LTGFIHLCRLAGPMSTAAAGTVLTLSKIPLKFKPFGLPKETIIPELKKLSRPDAALVTSVMTYWYPGVKEAVELARLVFPGVPVILGGNYATLYLRHAAEAIAPDFLFQGSDNTY